VAVVASGVKSILDIAATLERLDSLGVPVVGFATNRFPGFYLRDSGFGVDWTLDDVDGVARAFDAHRHFSPTGMLVANPVGADSELPRALHEAALASALDVASRRGVTGKDVTPVLLEEFARFTSGASVQVNRDLVVSNAALAGRVAASLARARS